MPVISHNTLKRAERQVGPAVEGTAKERRLTESQQRIPQEQTPTQPESAKDGEEDRAEVEIVAKYDFGWNKRGNGFCYDSHSGHGSLIGNLSNKILSYGTKSKVCAKCSRGHKPEDHDCRKNWTGSSKAMEPATAVELIWIKTWAEANSSQREGITYASGMGNTMARAVSAAAVTNFVPTQRPLSPDCAAVIVDTETTGLQWSAQLVQIAAKCGDNVFSKYMLPTCEFSPEASEKNGMRVDNGVLYVRNEPEPTTDREEIAHEFLQFLATCGSQTILVGHNLIRFDAPRIVQFLKSFGLLEEFCAQVYGFTDTMPLIRQGNVRKQDLLAQTYLTTPEWKTVIANEHSGDTDCTILDGLLRHFKVDHEKITSSSLPICDFFLRHNALLKKRRNLPTLQALKTFVSAGMLGKMASHGITIEELKEEYAQHGRKGIEVCLGVQLNGKPRVTKSKRVIDKVEEFLKSNV